MKSKIKWVKELFKELLILCEYLKNSRANFTYWETLFVLFICAGAFRSLYVFWKFSLLYAIWTGLFFLLVVYFYQDYRSAFGISMTVSFFIYLFICIYYYQESFSVFGIWTTIIFFIYAFICIFFFFYNLL